MKHDTKQHVSTKHILSMAVFASLTMFGCAGEIEEGEGEEIGLQSESVTQTTWAHCANRGATCTFTGTKQVRYGVPGNQRVGTFTNRVFCAGSSFNTSPIANAKCEVATTVTTPDAPPPPAPTPAPPPAPTPAPTPVDPHAGHMMPTTPGALPGVAFNASLIPAGNVGFGGVAIKPASDSPRASDGTGSFRTECSYSHMNNDDPLVFPGQVGAAHLHAYFGNKNTNAHSTVESLRSSGNSTCRGGIANRSAYWVPAIIDTATGAPQKPYRGSMYYKTGYGGVRPDAVRAFPQGLRMLAGDPKASGAQTHAHWTCQEFWAGKLSSIPNNCGVGNHIVMVLQFPQCWNGKDLDSPDHRSHMAYPVNGGCPSTHPNPIPEISFNIVYKVPASGTANWRLSSDMYDRSIPGGRSIHGDWMDGWDPNIVKTWVANCDNKAVDCGSHLLGDGREIYEPNVVY